MGKTTIGGPWQVFAAQMLDFFVEGDELTRWARAIAPDVRNTASHASSVFLHFPEGTPRVFQQTSTSLTLGELWQRDWNALPKAQRDFGKALWHMGGARILVGTATCRSSLTSSLCIEIRRGENGNA